MKKITTIILTAFFSLPGITYAQSIANEIIASGTELIELFDGGEGFLLEGPCMSPSGELFFTDIPFTMFSGLKAGIIWKYNLESKEPTVFRSPSGMANGMAFDADGNLIVCEGADFGGQRVIRTDMSTGKSEIIAGLYNGEPFNGPNDVVIDESGRIYFTDPRYFGHEPIEQKVMGVYRIDNQGKVELIIANASNPNGIIISPDQKSLYIANFAVPGNYEFPTANFTGVRQVSEGEILAYDLLQDGSVKFRKELINLGNLGPDGMTIDMEENLYIAHGNKVGIYNNQGEKLYEIEIPKSPVSNLTFGREKYSKTLFITAGKSLFSIQTQKEGYHIPFNK
ncbi:SMP-30/gluconolactonase/LRE family protein [Algoriphagus lutimaris]|uniref:SMP-30/gluconolactonase/LRE family protein n=1 Tax=Algoriphagus lutimaris TaxID=613197 RepID=UPI00196AD72D|nr:SMP-30/gluconolactonase/LRE family protein [Algoriphagus lutimaris]MBN3521031.1 SMP-30/gluconolactonase/LRE family protein [Algoriphagus lutimaris]